MFVYLDSGKSICPRRLLILSVSSCPALAVSAKVDPALEFRNKPGVTERNTGDSASQMLVEIVESQARVAGSNLGKLRGIC